jgi:hypothetical protein
MRVHAGGAWRSGGEGDGGVAGPAVELGAAVDARKIAVTQPVVGGDPVRDRVVDGRADPADKEAAFAPPVRESLSDLDTSMSS